MSGGGEESGNLNDPKEEQRLSLVSEKLQFRKHFHKMAPENSLNKKCSTRQQCNHSFPESVKQGTTTAD